MTISARSSLVSFLLIVGMAVALWIMGRDIICPCGTIKLWGGGAPLEESSKHILDWYAPSHLIHGFLFYGLLWLVARRVPLGWKLVIAIVIEGAWEIAENTDAVIQAYRELPAGAGYSGDSILNSVVDVFAMIVGFFMAKALPIWASIAIIVGFEILTISLIRDGLALNVLMLLYPIEAVADWQTSG